jgi:hypothetical protein
VLRVGNISSELGGPLEMEGVKSELSKVGWGNSGESDGIYGE